MSNQGISYIKNYIRKRKVEIINRNWKTQASAS